MGGIECAIDVLGDSRAPFAVAVELRANQSVRKSKIARY